MKVIYVNYGIGSSFKDRIELNKNLKKEEYSNLHDYILRHELSHTKKPFSLKDLFIDTFPEQSPSNQLLNFILDNPSSWTFLLPIFPTNYQNKFRISVNLNLLAYYALIVVALDLIL